MVDQTAMVSTAIETIGVLPIHFAQIRSIIERCLKGFCNHFAIISHFNLADEYVGGIINLILKSLTMWTV